MKKLTIKIPQDRDRLYSLIRYPAGEIQVRLTKEGLKACQGKEGYEIICNPIPDLLELAQLKDALDGTQTGTNCLNRGHWFERHLFLPYMPYARADRRFVEGDSFGLKVWANLISSLGFTSIWTFDVHSTRAYKLFEPSLANLNPTDRPVDQIAPIIRKLGRKGLALMLPDSGANARYGLDRYSLPVAVGLKHRDAKTGALTGFGVASGIFDIERARKLLIIDDICDGGGTFIGLAEALHKINPELALYLYTSHGIYSKGKEELLKHFKQVFKSEYSFDSDDDW